MADDYTDVNLKRCILSGTLWCVAAAQRRSSKAGCSPSGCRGAEGTAGGSLIVRQIKKANKVNLVEPEKDGDVVDDPHENVRLSRE